MYKHVLSRTGCLFERQQCGSTVLIVVALASHHNQLAAFNKRIEPHGLKRPPNRPSFCHFYVLDFPLETALGTFYLPLEFRLKCFE